MKRLIVVVGCGIAIAVALVAFGMTAEFTECYGDFRSVAAAEAAAADAESAGFEARMDHDAVVVFEDGDTGDDAADFRSMFEDVLRRHGGIPAHPGEGCSERTGFN